MSQTLQPPPPADLDKFEKAYPELGKWLRLLTGLFKPNSWREVDDTAGKNPAFENSWVNYNAGTTETIAFYKDSLSRVWLKGSGSTGASGTAIFTLPEEYRPSLAMYFSGDGTSTGGGSGDTNLGVIINTDGTIVPTFAGGGTSSRTSIDGISWLV